MDVKLHLYSIGLVGVFLGGGVMKNKFLISSLLIVGISVMTFVFQNCAGASQDDIEQASTGKNDSTLNKLNYFCQNESVANSPLGKTLEMNSGDMMYCEFELINESIGIQSKNNVKGTVDRETPYAVSELITQNWKVGQTKSGKKGLIFRWQPEFTTVENYSTVAYASVVDRTVLDKVDGACWSNRILRIR